MNRILSPAKALRRLRKNPVILGAVLAGLSQERAESLHDIDHIEQLVRCVQPAS